MDEVFPYTPRKAKFEVLEATFMARQVLLNELVTSIKEQADAETFQHWMILGSRGMGKSHLMMMVYHIVKKYPYLNLCWMPVLMNEEEHGVFSLPTLFTRILTKLADELEKSDRETAGKVHSFLDYLRSSGSAPDRVLENTQNFLKDYVAKSGKRLLVFLENTDDLFTKCLPKVHEVKQLRKILQHDNELLVIATSPTFFEGIRNRKGVFYDFFRIRRLDLLTYDEAISLLKKWAEIAGDDIGREFKRENYRLRVLYHLTGGNPRILLFLYMAIAETERLESCVGTFQILLEKDLSNYYLSRLRDIPNQEQPVVTALAEASHNLTQKEIAERTFLPLRSIGTSMGRLENAGLIRPVTEKKGKNTLYTLTDHMFRLWYQWRTNLREKQVIEALVEFLSIWFKRTELEQLLSCDGIAANYAHEALIFRETERFKDHIEDLCLDSRAAVTAYIANRNYHAALDIVENLHEYTDKEVRDIKAPLLDAVDKMETIKDLEDYLDALKSYSSSETAAVLVALSAKLIKKELFDKAEEALCRAVKLAPKAKNTLKQLGLVRIRLKRYGEAEDALNRAVELEPKDADAWYYLGGARGIQNNYAGAEEAFSKVVGLVPEKADAWLSLGICRSHEDKHAGAEEAFSKAAVLAPEDADVWYSLGQTRRDQNNYVGAEEALSKAAELAPEDADVWRSLGQARRDQNNYVGAEEALSKAIKIAPTDVRAWCYLGLVRGQQQNYVGAEEALSKAVELDPAGTACSTCSDIWRYLGFARGNQGKYAEAELALSKAVELTPEDANSWYYLGKARRDQNNYTGAEQAFTKAIEFDAEKATTWLYLGLVREHQGNFIGAEEALVKATKLAPEDAHIWFHLGNVRESQGNCAGAEEALKEAVKLEPTSIMAWQLLSNITFHNYRFSDCIEYSKKGLSNTDNWQVFLEMLSKIETRIERVPELLGIFETYLQAADTSQTQKTYLYFYRAFVLLNRKDLKPFKADLRAGLKILQTLSKEEKVKVQGDLIEYLVCITYGDHWDEIKTFLKTFRDIGPESAAVFTPLDYVIDYLDAARERDGKRDKIAAMKRAEIALDRVPTELREPVEDMVDTIKKNQEWWAKWSRIKRLYPSARTQS